MRGTDVDGHFGHCEGFTVFTLDERRAIVAEEPVVSPAGCGCKSGIGATLAKMGVTHLVAGNMGDGALHVLASHGISVTRGAAGNARAAVERFAAGTLADSGGGCAEACRSVTSSGCGTRGGSTPATRTIPVNSRPWSISMLCLPS